MLKGKAHKILLFLFITFLVMNTITHSMTIFLVGKLGKMSVTVIGIIVLQKSYQQFVDFITKYSLLVVFWALCVLFSVIRIFTKEFDFTLLQNNVLFIVFIYFYYVLYLAFKAQHLRPHYHFFKVLANAININFAVWTLIAFAFSFTIWHNIDGRTGLGLFFENYIPMGIFACVGGIVNFSLYREKTDKNRKLHLLMFFLFAVLSILSNSRNSQLVLFAFVFFNLFPYIKNRAVKNSYPILFIVFSAFILFFSTELLLTDSFTKFTTGRNKIWNYVYEYFSEHSIFIGEGLSGLNKTILEANITATNYYFQQLDILSFHSSYIEAYAAGGILSFILFVFFLLKRIHQKQNYYIIIIILSILIGGLFESYLIQPAILISFLFWYLILSGKGNLVKKQYNTSDLINE